MVSLIVVYTSLIVSLSIKTHYNFALQSKHIKGIWLVVLQFSGLEVERAECVHLCVCVSVSG